MITKQENVKQFLAEFKKLAITGRNFQFYERPERNSTLLDLGLTYSNFKELLLHLSVLDYSSGPEPDLDTTKKGDVWIFGTMANEHEIYIKLKIIDQPPEKWAICMSCHKAERPLKYPFRSE